MAKILTITAHPDDLEYYAGGFLLKAIQKKHEIYSIILSNGELSPKDKSQRQNIQTRQMETKKAISFVKKIFFLNIKDGQVSNLKQTELKKLNHIFEKVVHPDFVITHNSNDYHADHRYVSQISKQIISFKVPIIYMDTFSGYHHFPDFFVDISNEFSEKITLLEQHISQKHLLLPKRSKILNQYRALQYLNEINKYAEAFFVDKSNGTKKTEQLFFNLNNKG